MNKEQIIIDGVDVSGCINLDYWKHCDNCSTLIKTVKTKDGNYRNHLVSEEDLRCEYYPNCYYKQLQRKTKEYNVLTEKFANVLELSKKGIDAYEYCIRELEKENEK